MSFYPRFTNGQQSPHPVGKIICIGRNYAAHAKELDNPVPDEPLIFIKPSTSALQMRDELELRFDLGDLHYEAELALLIDKPLTRANESETVKAIGGMGLALDLTLREVQSKLKKKGQPWELAKGFDGSCPLTSFIEVDDPEKRFAPDHPLTFSLTIDGQQRQLGDTSYMLFSIPYMLSFMSHYFTLAPGDIVLTGTPEGVGKLEHGQQLELKLESQTLGSTRLV